MADIMVRYDDLRRYCEKNHCGSVQFEYIKQMFAVEAEPVRHGRWIIKPHGSYRQLRAFCSACGKHSGIGGIESNQRKPFCPNCGARMEGVNQKMTNGDRIRQMTDEGLVREFSDSICNIVENCEKDISCYDCKMQWLKQEVSEDDYSR